MQKIIVVGLGPGELEQLPLGIYRLLQQKKHPLYLRTKAHPVVQELATEGVEATRSFDALYEETADFDQTYTEIVKALFEAAKLGQTIIYAVPGHPLVAEQTVQLLYEKHQEQGVELEVIGGQSFLDPIFTRLKLDPVEGFTFLDAGRLDAKDLQPHKHHLITQVYDQFTASELKLTLMQVYPDDYLVTLLTAVGTAQEVVQELPLYELDRGMEVSNLTALYIPATTDDIILNRTYAQARWVFQQLRGPNGCPWDREQTHQSLIPYMREEIEEAIAAIENGDVDEIVEELGDCLLQIFLQAQIGEDEGYMNMEDILQSLNQKMLRRHPHVFGGTDKSLESAEDVVTQWQEIKAQEKKAKEK